MRWLRAAFDAFRSLGAVRVRRVSPEEARRLGRMAAEGKAGSP